MGTFEWDTCAAHAVVKGAGGNVFELTSGREITYNRPNLLNCYFICQPMWSIKHFGGDTKENSQFLHNMAMQAGNKDNKPKDAKPPMVERTVASAISQVVIESPRQEDPTHGKSIPPASKLSFSKP